MRTYLAAVILMVLLTPGLFAIGDIAVGPFFGMALPIANDNAESGSFYGVQARVGLMSGLSVGAHYHSRSYGNPSRTFFEGSQFETVMEVDGGSVTSFGVDAYLGKTAGAPGFNLFLVGSYGTYKWTRDNFDNISKTALAVGPGAELVLPMTLGIEGRAVFEMAFTGEEGTWKSLIWFVGANYHFGVGPMK
jgi:hypothetical protein